MKQLFNRSARGGTEEMKMFQSIRKYFSSGLSSTFATQAAWQENEAESFGLRPEKEKQFLLPETTDEFRAEKARIIRETGEERAAHLARAAELEQRAAKLDVADCSAAQRELNRREASRLREEAYMAGCRASYFGGELGTTTGLIKKAEKQLRQTEWDKIAHQGEILQQKMLEESGSITGSFSHAGGWRCRRERRLVRYEGNIFLVVFLWRGKSRVTHHSSGGYKGGGWDEYFPTGEFEPPELHFVTSSVSQMTEEELKAIA